MDQGKANTGRRLRAWRKSAHMKLMDLSDRINVAASSLSELENEKSLPSADTLIKLFYKTNLDIIWLLTGQGSMLREEPIAEDGTLLHEDSLPYRTDLKLKKLINKVIRVYQYGDQEKVAYLSGFLDGADPQGG